MELTRRQDEIVQAAIRLIADGGLESLTTKNLAARIGVTEPTLYRHFPGKQQILEAILGFFEKMTRDLIEETRREDVLPLEQARIFLRKRCGEFLENPALTVVILSEELFTGHPELKAKVGDIMQLNRDFIFNTVSRGQQSGEIRTDIGADVLADLIMGPFRLIVNRWRHSGFRTDLAREFGPYWEAVEKIARTNVHAERAVI